MAMSSRTSRRTSSSLARTSGVIFFFAIVLLEQLVQLSFDPQKDEQDLRHVVRLERRQPLIVHPAMVMGGRLCGKMAAEAMA